MLDLCYTVAHLTFTLCPVLVLVHCDSAGVEFLGKGTTHPASSVLPTDSSRTGHETSVLGAIFQCHDLGHPVCLFFSCFLSLGRVALDDVRGCNGIVMDAGMSGL